MTPEIADYTAGKTSFVVGLSPDLAVGLSGVEVAETLNARLGAEFRRSLDPGARVPSHLSERRDGNWLRHCNTVGINVRTIGSFWKVVKYALTLPDHVRGVHLLPIWEPGVVGSLYGMASWNLNPEFVDPEMARMFPRLRSPEDQLTATVNLLHAMGKVVGMDVIPHTDRYSEMVLANPAHFEWLRRDDLSIVDHRANLHEAAQASILEWLSATTPGHSLPPADFWTIPEADRLLLLFGRPADYERRRARRVDLVDWLYRRGFEPVPATMAPPYRGLEVDPAPEAVTVDLAGRQWRDYRITQPTEMSRVFGPLARYKFYGRHDDNRAWAIDFDRPRVGVWDYFTGHYAAVQRRYGFDFMRGDMSHVQMRPGGVPKRTDDYYDPLRAVKQRIQLNSSHFAYFAESFLAPNDYMAYGSEVEHLVASEAEVTLGNLQSLVPGSVGFMDALRQYLEIAEATSVTPALTAITGDKDDPRFDGFYLHAELARLFAGLFLPQLPLYYSLGFELRDRHYEPAANECYTKLYVFQEREGPKSVTGHWRWGQNRELWQSIQELHRFAEGSLPHMGADAGAVSFGEGGVIGWQRTDTYGDRAYFFAVNFSDRAVAASALPVAMPFGQADLLYAWPAAVHHSLPISDGTVSVGEMGTGAVRCYELR